MLNPDRQNLGYNYSTDWISQLGILNRALTIIMQPYGSQNSLQFKAMEVKIMVTIYSARTKRASIIFLIFTL